MQIDGDILPENYDFLSLPDYTYQLNTVPTEGELLLNGVPLGVGDTFSQENVNSGNLLYNRTGTTVNADQFGFSVRSTVRVSEGAVEGEGNEGSFQPAISSNGQCVVFATEATNFSSQVSLDSNGTIDVVVKDMTNGAFTLISHAVREGFVANGLSWQPDIAPDGEFVVFESAATNIIDATDPSGVDSNGVTDIYGRSVAGAGSNSRFSLFPTSLQITGGNSSNSTVSDLQQITYQTVAPITYTNVIEGNSGADVMLYDNDNDNDNNVFTLSIYPFLGGTFITGDNPSQAARISADGNHFAFQTAASDLVINDTNGSLNDILIQSRGVGLSRVSIDSNGVQSDGSSTAPDISRFGRFVVFMSTGGLIDDGTNSNVQIYLHDRDTDEDNIYDEVGAVKTILISRATDGGLGSDGSSTYPRISANGRFVTFQSDANNLVSGDSNGSSDIFVHDRDLDRDGIFDEAGTTRLFRVSIASDGTQANGSSTQAAISDNGDFVAFTSSATNLVDGDNNGVSDVFVHYIGFAGSLQIEPYKQFLPAILR